MESVLLIVHGKQNGVVGVLKRGLKSREGEGEKMACLPVLEWKKWIELFAACVQRNVF